MVIKKIIREPMRNTQTHTHFTKRLPFKRNNNFIAKLEALNVRACVCAADGPLLK